MDEPKAALGLQVPLNLVAERAETGVGWKRYARILSMTTPVDSCVQLTPKVEDSGLTSQEACSLQGW